MYVADRLVFVELHKTGGSHIGKLLSKHVPGLQVGKHNRVPDALRHRPVIGSVRNPWDWYVSLWAYGCSGLGSVRKQCTRRVDIRYLLEELSHEMGRKWNTPSVLARQLIADVIKPVKSWKGVYADPESPEQFRTWLRMVLDEDRRFDVAEGFGFSPLSGCAGLMTYRYVKLFARLDQRLYNDSSLSTNSGVRAAFESSRLAGFIIRTEHLEDDFIAALAWAGYELDADAQASVRASRAARTNKSERREASYYYDEETIDLVKHRERLIIDTHGYLPPAQAGWREG